MSYAVILALSLALLGSPQANKETVEQHLIRLKHEMGQAYVVRDIAALERLYADDYTVTDSEGNTTNKTQEIDRLRTGKSTYESTSYEDVKVRVYGDTAIVAGRGTVKGRNADGPFHTEYHSTNVFVKQKGVWRAVAAHISGVKSL